MAWSYEGLPRLDRRLAVVTGANSGIGFEAAWMLAARGAHVIMACRNPEKAEKALDAARAKAPGAEIDTIALDLGSLQSVKTFARAVGERFSAVHLLVNNAGVMALPFTKTVDGFEMQFGVNHLGHFALTGLLLPALQLGGSPETPARVVNISSGLHRSGRIYWDDLDGEKSYEKWTRYSQSKLANLLFTYELSRRMGAKGMPVRSVAAHPGYAATNLQFVGPQMAASRLQSGIMTLANALFAQSAEQGAWPTVYAAAAPEVAAGDYIGPAVFEMWGAPKKVASSAASRSETDQRRLWEVSERLTGVSWAG